MVFISVISTQFVAVSFIGGGNWSTRRKTYVVKQLKKTKIP
jgi:hypothetical protein